MIRVGVLIDRWEPTRGGMERALCSLVERLLAEGDHVDVFGLTASAGAPGAFHAIDLPRLRRGVRERRLAEESLVAADRLGCDVTLAIRHTPRADVYWPHGGSHAATLAAGEASRGAASGAVSRLLHRLSPRHREFLALEAEVIASGARVWCVSDLVRHELAASYPDARLELHPNGVDLDTFARASAELRAEVRAEHGLADDEHVALFMGGNWRLKGWRVLVEALSMSMRHPTRVLAAGDDVERAVSYARGAGVGDAVVAARTCDAARLFAAADVLAQPTFRDPCSLATLESLACGVPVITTEANGAADAFDGDVSGTLVPVGDARAVAAALDAHASERAIPAEVRRCVEGRSHAAWLDGLVESLRAVASPK